MLAEQQRAKSEIEAALTVAQARPRDQAESLRRIITSCQRPKVAENSQYMYARGGTDISGPNIRLMEVIAQNWGNIEWGFRELARFPGTAGQPGESIVEAMAWDLETNSRVRKQFTVSHSERTKKGLKVFTDPRDLYEWVANQAQRRVRTCLENIIPRDIQETACEECDQTNKARVKLTPETIASLIKAFEQFGVTKDMLTSRLQRDTNTITPAQYLWLRKTWASLRDGIARPDDFFDLSLGNAAAGEEPARGTATEKAKTALKKRAPQAAKKAEPAPEPDREMTNDEIVEEAEVNTWIFGLNDMDLEMLESHPPKMPERWSADAKRRATEGVKARIDELKAEKQPGPDQDYSNSLFDDQPSATEMGF